MYLLGLDPSQSTGFCLWNVDGGLSANAVQFGTMHAEGKTYDDQAASIGRQFNHLLRAHRPDMIVKEGRLMILPKGTAPKTMKFMGDSEADPNDTVYESSGPGIFSTISSSSIHGALMSQVGVFEIPCVSISTATWRKHFLGFGRRDDWQTPDWKKAAKDKCRQHGLSPKNEHECEAMGIAFAGSHTQEFKMLLRSKQTSLF